jgi:RNA polymerase sigma-70 factor (ECF subfamily)
VADEDLPLVKALQDGDDHALDELMARHKTAIFRFIYRHVFNEADAAELTQETFVRAYFHINSFKPRARFSTWLYAIAGNLCRDHLGSRAHRNASRTYSLSADRDDKPVDVIAGVPTPEEAAEQNEHLSAVEAAIAELPYELKSALVLTAIEGNSHMEAAEKLGITPKAVETRVYRARKRLEKILRIS